jgi:predicted transcriptional regulator
MTLKRLRQKKGLTQTALGTEAKLHRAYVAQIEAQTKTPSLAALESFPPAPKSTSSQHVTWSNPVGDSNPCQLRLCAGEP